MSKLLFQTLLIIFTIFFTACGGGTSSTTISTEVPSLQTSVLYVAEDISSGSTIGTLTILDIGDSSISSISLSGTGSDNFIVSTNGTVSLQTGRSLDYETTTIYTLSAVATNAAGDSLAVILTINVTDVADVVATLESFNTSIDENTSVGTSVGIVNVLDTGDSQITSFTLNETTHFTITSNGELTTASSFDYEITTLYNLTVFATNSAGDSSNVNITINILDIFEPLPSGIPILEASTANVAEDANVGDLVGNVTIFDEGDTPISSITLSGTGSENFDVATDGNITVSAGAVLDYETSPSYSLSAFATNTQGDSQSVSVNINVTNIIDTVAILSNFTGAINENASIGTLVGSVTVLDTGDSDITSFTLNDTTNFDINTSGVISTKTVLDYETQSVYNLNVYASNGAGNSNPVNVTINIVDVFEPTVVNIPTVVVVMNWNDYFETDPLIWHNKIFNKNDNSLNQWYDETMDGTLQVTPVAESSGTANDGVIMVDMGKNHPGGYNDTTFRDTEIVNAITNSEVENSMDFAALDTDGDGSLNAKELQIIFIVAGGELSFTDPIDHSIWAHAWSFNSDSTLSVDGVKVMRYTGDVDTSGSYARFGANHASHKATVGIIVHEVGHSLLALGDYYDPTGASSGLGWYDVMSGGGWSSQDSDTYPGETPTQFSAYNRIDANIDINLTAVSASEDLNINCSSKDVIKLQTSKPNEFFVLECRDTAKANSDIAIDAADPGFTDNRLFTMLYHVDTDKLDNTEGGVQTDTDHYKVSVVEKSSSSLMTLIDGIDADLADVYLAGDVIDSTKTRLYDGTNTGYQIEVIYEDKTDRTMTLRITK